MIWFGLFLLLLAVATALQAARKPAASLVACANGSEDGSDAFCGEAGDMRLARPCGGDVQQKATDLPCAEAPAARSRLDAPSLVHDARRASAALGRALFRQNPEPGLNAAL